MASNWQRLLDPLRAPAPRPARPNWQRLLEPTTAAPSTPSWQRLLGPAPMQPDRGAIFSGGPISDIFDALSVFNYAVAGVATGKGIRRGIRERTTFEEYLTQRGMQPGIARTLAGLALDIGLDPTTYIGIGAVEKGIKLLPGGAKVLGAIGRGGKIAAARVGLAFTPTQDVVLRVVDEALRKEGVAAEKTVDLVKGIRRSADISARGDKVRSTLYRRALGGYFDVGADELIGYARKAEAFPALKADTAGIRRTAGAAQQNYLQALPGDVRAFVEKWAPVVRGAEENQLDNLVRVGRIAPETAEKWRGFHLRPFYSRFRDEEQFINFLRQTDPARAMELLSKQEVGPVIRGAGRGIPSEVGKRRQLLSTERGLLGEVPEADMRIAASHPLYDRAVARGEMLQALARDFAHPQLEQLASLPGGDKLFRRMPAAETWGPLAGKVVPKDVFTILTQYADAPTKWEQMIGFWKSLKVVDNPATHGRNIRTMLMQQVPAALGLRAFDPRIWVDAIQDVALNRPMFQEAKKVASWAYDTFTTRERLQVAQRLNESRTLGDFFAAPFRAYHAFMARAYNFEDLVGRQAIFRTLMGRGISAQAAAMAADTAMINYRRIPPALQFLRRKGFYPFVSWPYGVVTQVIPQALKHPGQAFAPLKAIRAFTEPFTAEEEQVLPGYMRTGGYVKIGDHVLALLPWLKDPQGRPVAYDLTYELMFGDIAEQGTPIGTVVNALTGRIDPKALVGVALTPLGQLVAEVGMNFSAFTGAPIQQPEEPWTKRAVYAARAIAPGTPFELAEAALAKTGVEQRAGLQPVTQLAQAVTGTPTSLGKQPPGAGSALTRVLTGARTVPIDVPAEARARRVELSARIAEIDKRMRSVARSKALTPEIRSRRLVELRRKRQEILDAYRRKGVVPGE